MERAMMSRYNRKVYSMKGILLQHLKYADGELDGTSIYYNGKGEKISEGTYTKGRKDAGWKYYKKDSEE